MPLGRLAADYEALMDGPCFLAAEESWSGRPRFRSRAQLVSWWEEGGRAWLAAYARGIPSPASPRQQGEALLEIVVPPELREVLSRQTAPRDHPLWPLLCDESDARCGRDTEAWRARAARALPSLAERPRGAPDTRASRIAECERAAHDAAPERAFIEYYACVSSARPHTSVLPLGATRAPTRGWFVVRGRRGHYSFCDEVRAYDLATGAAYVVSSCSGLALRSDGSVHGGATDAARREADLTGRLPVQAIREAAWMTMMASEVDDQHQRGWRFTLPAGISPRWLDDGTRMGSGFAGSWGSSAQTVLRWSWVLGGRTQASGELTWPDSARTGEAHAAELLADAEARLVSGCAPAPLPRRLALGPGESGVSSVDADPIERGRLEEALTLRLAALRAPRCAR